jgi:acetyl-CoA carboxylase, biotin carboxylase subunit
MRVAHNEPSLQSAFHSARHEAEKAFGNDQVYLERLIINPHHIEFQIVADGHGHIVQLGERDCSIQRRNQKVIEECPSPLMAPGLRRKMGHAAVKLAKSVEYENAGTIEFLVDQDRHFYFMEMNTRIQVEHTITEEVYGCDLVKEQIRIAAGERLSEHVANATPRLHAIECRINAEDPEKDFQATPGRIDFYYAPGGRGVRIDSHAYTGYTVPSQYDSLIAKIITVGATRINAIERMRRALDEYYITGIKTTVPFHAAIMRNGDFRAGNYDTGFIEQSCRLATRSQIAADSFARVKSRGRLSNAALTLTTFHRAGCSRRGLPNESIDAANLPLRPSAGSVWLRNFSARDCLAKPRRFRDFDGRVTSPLFCLPRLT